MASTRESVRLRYEALAQSGEIVADASQAALVDALDALLRKLGERARSAGGPIGWLARRGRRKAAPRGLYVWGEVGRGKTLLMDLFFAAAPTKRKRRVHFHAFMAEVHDRIAAFRKDMRSGEARGRDPIAAVGGDIASEIELLCFDEFAVYDIADAMILGRLFAQLFANGVTIVATTNVAPDDLYEGGLNRALFLPFIALIKKHMQVFHLDAPRDYRLDAGGTERRYVTPLGAEADQCLDAHFRHLTGRAKGEPKALRNKGRQIDVPEAADGVARFSFADLCGRPLGAGDYLKIAEAFPTIVLADIPVLAPTRRNEAKRLIILIDTFYDRMVRLIVSAEAEPGSLWLGSSGAEAFEFQRTASRLVEMRSDAYWEAATRALAEKEKARAFPPGPVE